MATPDSSGVQRRRVRLDGNRPRTHPSARSRRKPPRKPLKAKAGALDRSLQGSLTDVARRVEVIAAVAVTAEGRAQSAELRAGCRHRPMPTAWCCRCAHVANRAHEPVLCVRAGECIMSLPTCTLRHWSPVLERSQRR
jgi:hypothetical protein